MKRFLRTTVTAALIGATGWLAAGCQQAPVTGRNQLILLSDNQAVEMGLQAYQQILSESKLSNNRTYVDRVRRVGQRIAAVSDKPDLKWEFNVIEDDTPNAFALPGGKVGVHTGLFKVARNDDQLATVLAHEVGHAIARHSAERISTQMAVQLGVVGLGLASGREGGQWVNLAATAATLGVVLPFTRNQEAEADHIGLMLMAKAGYDPRQAIPLWENFREAGGSRPPEFLSTHPSPDSRIDRLRRMMPEAMKVYEQNRR